MAEKGVTLSGKLGTCWLVCPPSSPGAAHWPGPGPPEGLYPAAPTMGSCIRGSGQSPRYSGEKSSCWWHRAHRWWGAPCVSAGVLLLWRAPRCSSAGWCGSCRCRVADPEIAAGSRPTAPNLTSRPGTAGPSRWIVPGPEWWPGCCPGSSDPRGSAAIRHGGRPARSGPCAGQSPRPARARGHRTQPQHAQDGFLVPFRGCRHQRLSSPERRGPLAVVVQSRWARREWWCSTAGPVGSLQWF